MNEWANLYSTYGIYGVLAALTLCVIYLYKKTERQYADLSKIHDQAVSDMQTIAKEATRVSVESTEAIRRCTIALEKMDGSISSLKTDIIEIKANQ